MDQAPEQISQHVPRMYRVAYRMLGDEDWAHDVVQEACLKALSKADGFDGRAALATWLHRITVNCAKDALRGRARKERFSQVLQDQADGSDGATLRPCPSQTAETRELSELALIMLDRLPQDCRIAFALTQLDGYTYEEAADIQGEPRGTIASRVYLAKKILLERMNAHIEGGVRS